MIVILSVHIDKMMINSKEVTMHIDILSDTHFDSWLGYPHLHESKKLTPHKESVISLW